MNLLEKLARAVDAAVASPAVAPIVQHLRRIADRRVLGELLSTLRIDCVIDAGANEGQYVRLIRRFGFTGLILSFEPHPEAFRVMQNTFVKDHNWRGYNCALGNLDGELDFNFFESSEMCSFLPGTDLVHSKLDRTAKVPVRRLDTLLPEILPDWSKRRLFLKCDTEGFDVEVVKGAAGTLAAVYGLESEVAMQIVFRGEPRYLEALSYYESLGFVLVDLWLNCKTADGDALECECLMKRNDSDNLKRTDYQPSVHAVDGEV